MRLDKGAGHMKVVHSARSSNSRAQWTRKGPVVHSSQCRNRMLNQSKWQIDEMTDAVPRHQTRPEGPHRPLEYAKSADYRSLPILLAAVLAQAAQRFVLASLPTIGVPDCACREIMLLLVGPHRAVAPGLPHMPEHCLPPFPQNLASPRALTSWRRSASRPRSLLRSARQFTGMAHKTRPKAGARHPLFVTRPLQ